MDKSILQVLSYCKGIKMSVLLGTLIVVCICGCGKNTVYYMNSESLVSETEDSSESHMALSDTEVDENPIYVYICGAVITPGVYTMPEGSRICDVFAKAGGLTEDAAEDYWNQARVLVDGEMIYVPTQKEAKERDINAENSGNANEEDIQNKININTASKEMLMKIPGVGEAKAIAIISYREEHGYFSTIEDIKKVEGIKDGVFSKMKDYIVVN